MMLSQFIQSTAAIAGISMTLIGCSWIKQAALRAL